MSTPFWKADPAAWPLAVEAFAVAYPNGWPRELVIEDLRWMADQVRLGKMTKPGRRLLARRWGWTDKPTRTLLVELDPFGSRSGPGEVPPRSRKGPASEQRNHGNGPGKSRQGPGEVPPGSRQGPHARCRQNPEPRTQNPEPEEEVSSRADLVLLHPPDEPEPPPDPWDRLNELYGSLPARSKLRQRDGDLGKNLSRLLDLHGLEGAHDALRWMAYGRGPKIEQLRESGCDTLATIGRARHAEAYAVHWRRWVQRGRPGDPAVEARRGAPPATDFETWVERLGDTGRYLTDEQLEELWRSETERRLGGPS